MTNLAEGIAAVHSLFLAIVRKLVDHPEAVTLESEPTAVRITFHLYVLGADLVSLKRDRGSLAAALRHLLSAFGMKYARRFELKFHKK